MNDAKAKLAHYCPGLKVSISGINYSNNSDTKTYTITYDVSSQKAVDAYINDKKNGFINSDGTSSDNGGFILANAIKHPNKNTAVVYIRLTQQIIIVENGN
jgi:hypothetical protein